MQVQSLGGKDPLEKRMVPQSSILAWEMPQREKPGGLQSVELQRVRHNQVHTQRHTRTLIQAHWEWCLNRVQTAP